MVENNLLKSENELSPYSGNALQVSTIGQMVKLNKGQSALLNLIRKSVTDGKSLSWDSLVECYYRSVRQKRVDYKYIGDYPNNKREWYEYDILESYQKQDWHWKYAVRGLIKAWFVSSIGVLVIKNQLIIIPTIEIN